MVNGIMLADVSGDELEGYLLEKGLVATKTMPADAPTDRGCSDEEHAAMQQGARVQFIN